MPIGPPDITSAMVDAMPITITMGTARRRCVFLMLMMASFRMDGSMGPKFASICVRNFPTLRDVLKWTHANATAHAMAVAHANCINAAFMC